MSDKRGNIHILSKDCSGYRQVQSNMAADFGTKIRFNSLTIASDPVLGAWF
jgi:hypothetical protein